MPTNTEIVRDVAEVKKLLEAHTSAFSEFVDRVEGVERRLTILEKRAIPVLDRVDRFFGHLKKVSIFVATTVAVQAIAWAALHIAGK